MARLPLIVGFGGINPAGRSSLHHGYRRLVLDSLPLPARQQTLTSLAALTGQLQGFNTELRDEQDNPVHMDRFLETVSEKLLRGSLIRRLEDNLFDPAALPYHKRIALSGHDEGPIDFSLSRRHLPDQLPPGWHIQDHGTDPGRVRVSVEGNLDVLLQCARHSEVNSAGQLPSGFDPGALYPARNHPRGLQLTVFGASDAINSLGLDWDSIRNSVNPDQISVYAGSGMSQLDYNGYGGMLQARLLGKKVTSKQLPLGYAEMPADFINAYVLGNLGTTGTNVAACATFLYNLRQGIRDIQMGTHRVVIVGTSEAPLVPEIFDGFATMGALADDDRLRTLDGLSGQELPDYRRACRPFGNNAGFTLAESAQFVVLFDDELALEMGANIYGAVNEVFVNADGFKKSIAGPGVGNYITLAKAAAATRNIIGDQGLQSRTFVQAHGTGTPQNRTTESHILSQVGAAFGIENWPVTAIKAHIGHSLASAAGDQLAASLGVWEYGLIPGITTTDQLADDVCAEGLDILLQHKQVDAGALDAVLINSKGFGGNNASASILAPHVVNAMLGHKHGARRFNQYQQRKEQTLERINAYDQKASAGDFDTIYRFGEGVLDADSVNLDSDSLRLAGERNSVSLNVPNNYAEFIKS